MSSIDCLSRLTSRYNHRVIFTLREAESKDFERLYEIDQECFPSEISYSRAELAYYMKMTGAFTLVAETSSKSKKVKSSEIAGFIVAQRHPKGMGHVVTIDTLPQFRREGLGTTLMNAAEERLRSAGCDVVILEAAVDNIPALKFYKRLGYFVLKTLPRYYQNKLDAFLLAKRFDSTSARKPEAHGKTTR